MEPGSPIGSVLGINRYPVKSFQGEVLREGTFDAKGLQGDREWGLVDVDSGHVLTAKRVDELLDAAARLTPAGPEIELPDRSVLRFGTVGDEVSAQVDATLSKWLNRPVELRRAVDSATFEMSFDVDDQDKDIFEWATPDGSFVDLAPVHLLTTASLAAAAELGPTSDWSPARFRPTILVETDQDIAGFVENDWIGARLAIGEVVLEVTMPTIRCSLPTRSQAAHGLERDLDVFKTLAGNNNQNLGLYATVNTPGTVRVGDPARLGP